MNTTVREEGNLYIATLEGRLDTASAEQTAKDLLPLNDTIGHDIVIDCSRLEYISSSGLRILLNIRKHAATSHSKVTLLNPNADIMKVFQMTGFLNLFDVKND